MFFILYLPIQTDGLFLTLCMLGNFLCFFASAEFFFQNQLFWKKNIFLKKDLSGIPSV